MLSGFTLLRKSLIINANSGVKTFYKKRWDRLGIALLAWNILYMLLHIVSMQVKGESQDGLLEMVYKFVFFKYNGFMWFFVPLIMIYIALPFFAQFVLNSERRLLRLFLIISLSMSFIPPMDNTPSSALTICKSIRMMTSPNLFFIVAGYYFGNYELSLRTRRWIYLLSILSVIVIYGGTCFLTLNVPEHYKYFLSYTNIPCSITAIGVFVFFKYTKWDALLIRLHITPEKLVKFSGLSLGIYLLQMLWFKVLGYIHICDNHIILKFFVMYLLCTVTVAMMKYIPIVKKLVP